MSQRVMDDLKLQWLAVANQLVVAEEDHCHSPGGVGTRMNLGCL